MTENMVNENNMTKPIPKTAPEFFGSRQYKMSAAIKIKQRKKLLIINRLIRKKIRFVFITKVIQN